MIFPLAGNSIYVKMSHFSEFKIFIETAQRDNGMDMRIPFQVYSECMNDRNQAVVYDVGISAIIFGKSRDFIFSLIFF